MTLEQLETFVQVARSRGFSRAAVLLDVAQPTVSGRVAMLERTLGVSLFARHGHSLELTEAGRSLLPYGERVLALHAEGVRAVEQVRRGGLGHLALGVNPSCSPYLAPALVETFWRAHPAARITIRTALTPALMEGLLDGALQLALCSEAQIHPRAEVLWRYRDRLHLIVASGHPLARKPTCRRDDLAGHTILSTQAGPTHAALRHILPRGEDPPVALEATAGDTLTRLLVRGLGVTVLPSLAVWGELKRGDLIAVEVEDTELPEYDVALVRWPRRELAPAAQVFAEQVRSARMPGLLDV